MKQDALNKIKASAFDWIIKAMIPLVAWYVKDVRDDVKILMQAYPALQAKVDLMTDQRLMDRLKIYQMMPAKPEEEITYDSLKRK